MARLCLPNLCAVSVALVFALAPQAGLAELTEVDLPKLRTVLRAIEANVEAGIETPVDVPAYWETFALPKTDVADPKEFVGTLIPDVGTEAPTKAATSFFGDSSAQPSTNGAAPQTSILTAAPTPVPASDPIVRPAVTAPAKTDRSLFSLQRAQAISAAATPTSTPDPAPAFGAVKPLGLRSPQPEPTRIAPQNVDTSNFRIMLAALSQTYTAENASAVVDAQGPRSPIAVSVRSGTVTLADIQSYSAALGLPPLQDGTLTAPVVIWPDATLRLTPGDRLALARDTGAFILAMGTLDINGATIEVTGPENAYVPSFVPFVTVAGSGSLTMKNAHIRGLGFGQTAKFSGLSVAGNPLRNKTGAVSITDSLFDNVGTVTLAGVIGAKVLGNTFINARDNALELINAPQAQVTNNFFGGNSDTNAIRVDKGSSETTLSRNIFLSGKRVAILVTGQSDHVEVTENLVWNRDGAGVKFLVTRCGLAKENIILDNRQKGVEVRKSNGTVVDHNLIAGNGSAGIWVSDQQPSARTSLSANVLAANGAGLSAATGAEILMKDNNLARQLPRLLDGDIARLTQHVATDLQGAVSLRLKDGVAHQGIDGPKLCGSDL